MQDQPKTDTVTHRQVDLPTQAPLDWRAIVAGAIGAAAISALLLGFGSAIGLSLTSAQPYAGLSATSLSVLLAVWLAIVHVGSFASGGYLAGRLRSRSTVARSENDFRDGAHGFLVWALGALIAAYLVASSVGTVVKATADTAASVVGGAAQTIAGRSNSASLLPDPLTYSVDLLLRRPASASTAASNVQPDPTTSPEIARILVVAIGNGSIAPPDRQYLSTLIATKTGLSSADAEKRIDETWTRYNAMKADAEQKVRETAEKSRRVAVMTAFLLCVVSLAGLVAAVWGATTAASHRDNSRTLQVFGRERFW